MIWHEFDLYIVLINSLSKNVITVFTCIVELGRRI